MARVAGDVVGERGVRRMSGEDVGVDEPMTPERQAVQATDGFVLGGRRRPDGSVTTHPDPDGLMVLLRHLITNNIRAAVAEEREACARLSERGEWDRTAAECSGECGADIARALRARGVA